MASANSPPREHLLDRLLLIDGENWVRVALIEHPGYAAHIVHHAERCKHCRVLLERIFPEGVPDIEAGEISEADLDRIFSELRDEHDRSTDVHPEPPES